MKLSKGVPFDGRSAAPVIALQNGPFGGKMRKTVDESPSLLYNAGIKKQLSKGTLSDSCFLIPIF